MDISLLSLVSSVWAACVSPPTPSCAPGGRGRALWGACVPSPTPQAGLPLPSSAWRCPRWGGCWGASPEPQAGTPTLAPACLPAASPLQPCSLSPPHLLTPCPGCLSPGLTVRAPLSSRLSCQAPAWCPGLVCPAATYLHSPVPHGVAPVHRQLTVCAASRAHPPSRREQPHCSVALG